MSTCFINKERVVTRGMRKNQERKVNKRKKERKEGEKKKGKKQAFHLRHNLNNKPKPYFWDLINQFLALTNSYHEATIFSKSPSLLSASLDLYADFLYSNHVNSLYKLSSPSISEGNGAIFSLNGGPPK